jgi:hypothetical protein
MLLAGWVSPETSHQSQVPRTWLKVIISTMEHQVVTSTLTFHFVSIQDYYRYRMVKLKVNAQKIFALVIEYSQLTPLACRYVPLFRFFVFSSRCVVHCRRLSPEP